MKQVDCEFDEGLFRLAKTKGRQLVGHYGMSWDDVDDIANELYMNCFQHSQSFDAGRSSRRTFQNRIINNAVIDLVRKLRAQFRGYGVVIIPLDHFNAQGAISDAEKDDLEQRLDILKAVHRMPGDLVQIALNLMEGHSASDTAQRLGISRAYLYRRLEAIRGLFEQAGFRPPSRKKTNQPRKGPRRRRPR